MKSDKLNLFLFHVFCLYEFIKGKNFFIEETNEIKNNNSFLYNIVNPSSYFIGENNLQLDGFETSVINRMIEKGKIQTEFINDSSIYEYHFSDFTNQSDLLVNYYPLDCKISIISNDKNDINITKISNYEYDAFSINIPNDRINSTFIRVKALINQLDDKNKKRSYHLIINSFDKNNPNLIFNEKFPTFIYFDSNYLKSINFSYNLFNSEDPVVISFFIKERAKFNVNILDSIIQNKTIGYKENIIIDPKQIYKNDNNIIISINKIDNKNCTMIVKISGNNSPFYLQKNILNLGFIPRNTSNHYYYMDIFKGEEGEIILHNKIHNVYLDYQIIKKNTINERELLNNFNDYFPKFDEVNYSLYNKYNGYSKKLNFSSYETKDCENGCYLLITYYSPGINMTYLDGIEYNLLARIWDEVEFKSQIVNIPLNEYTFGAIEPFSSSINAHYYSIYIPEDKEILFEFKGRNIQALAKKGIIQINFVKKPYNSLLLTKDIEYKKIEDEKLIIKLNKTEFELESFENQYLSFVFIVLDDDYSNTLINYYYFRIIQDSSRNNYTLYPLDTNKANLCQTSKFGDYYLCYFILKNDYKELYNFCSLDAYGYEEANFYKVWYFNHSDYYSIDINNIKEKNPKNTKDWINEGYFILALKPNFNYLLLEIHSKYKEILEVLFNFDGNFTYNHSLDIFSYQSFYLKTNNRKSFFFNSISPNKYIFVINNTSGDGYICFNQDCDNNEKKNFISEKTFLSFTITEKMKSIHFISVKNLFFYIKIKNIITNDVMEEINYGYNYPNITHKSKNSKAYFYIKNIYDIGVDINFIFSFKNINNNNNNIIISGYIIDYNDYKYISNYETLQNLLIYNYEKTINKINGDYDPFTRSGLISFNKINSKNESFQEDKYYLIEFYPQKNISDFSVEIFIDSKNESMFALQKNKYLRGSFDLSNSKNIQNKTYFIEIKRDFNYYDSVTYILEFSSNLKDIKPIFNNKFNYYDTKIFGGVQKFFILVDRTMTNYKLNFSIELNNSMFKNTSNNNNENGLYIGNYIINFYKSENEDNLEFIISKKIDFKKINKIDGNLFVYNFTIKKNKENKENHKITKAYNYTYSIRLYSKNSLYEHQILNTTALILYDKSKSFDNYCEYTTNDPYKDFYCIFSNITDNKQYILSMFIKIKDENSKENYLSNYFEIETKENKENKKNKKNKKTIITLSTVFGCIFIIIIIIIIYVYKLKNENINLKERVNQISFSTEYNEDRKSRNSIEDENSFI